MMHEPSRIDLFSGGIALFLFLDTHFDLYVKLDSLRPMEI